MSDMHHMPNMHHEDLIATIQDCEAICEHMITHLMTTSDIQSRRRQIQLLHDCADICTLTAKYIARRSPFAKSTANLCASICEACGAECAKFPDPESQNCSQICLNCARECRSFAMM
ncbi:four-helix bundle copper-binding protein [Clostridium sp. DJ247]|nr:four-helix bundle copper-binding protein [Clostridium sp. DJ247]